uniref:Uncharacterized protein n=1 Tax=Meloidogyne enterolobii TaxID=390850 RepID=A0A6V7VJC8_MELEN|nr:unnamed protein product [Meloidogyne enterolobii]
MKRNSIKQCKVCGTKDKVCFHYGVRTCRACGAFFRRYLESENKCRYIECNYICLQEQFSNKGEKSETNLADCKKCRLEKCFSVGMKKLDVGYIRQDICREAMEEQGNEINLSNPPIVDTTIKDLELINPNLLPIIEAKKRIMHAFNDLDDIFLKGPIFFEEIILSNFNIFRLTDNFSPNPRPIPFDELKSWESSLQNEGMLNSRAQKCFLVDRLLCVGIARSFPVFEKLTLSDQVAHLRQAYNVFISFTSSYLAWELGSETWTRKDGVMPALGLMKNSVLFQDYKILKWSDYSFTKSVGYFKRAALTKIEFALLIAIIFTKSNATDISAEGKELLLDESNKYTNILLRYNQRRLGLIEGAQRLAECSRLISRSIENEYALRLMLSHQLKYYSMGATCFKLSNFFENFLNKTD